MGSVQIVRSNGDEVIIIATFTEAGMIAGSLTFSAQDYARQSEEAGKRIDHYRENIATYTIAANTAAMEDDHNLNNQLTRRVQENRYRAECAEVFITGNKANEDALSRTARQIWEIGDEIIEAGVEAGRIFQDEK